MLETLFVWFAAVLLLLGGSAPPPAEAQTPTLTVGNAGGASADAERKAFYEPFGSANKVRIQEEAFNQELAKIRSQVDTGNVVWDVATVTAINEATGCEEGLYEKIEWSRHIDP